MFEPALIQQCADPGVEIAIVERFISEAGTDDPLAVRITSGNRVILPEAPKTPDESLRLIRHYIGRAVVRVGVTQYPAGHAITEPSQIAKDMVHACGNIRMGTALFGKVYRIVAHAHGESSSEVFREALEAWKTGTFEGQYVFGEADPGPLPILVDGSADSGDDAKAEDIPVDPDPDMDDLVVDDVTAVNPNEAGIRVDLSVLSSGDD